MYCVSLSSSSSETGLFASHLLYSRCLAKLAWNGLIYIRWINEKIHGLCIFDNVYHWVCVYQQHMESKCGAICQSAVNGGIYNDALNRWIKYNKISWWKVTMSQDKFCADLELLALSYTERNNIKRELFFLSQSFMDIYVEFDKLLTKIQQNKIDLKGNDKIDVSSTMHTEEYGLQIECGGRNVEKIGQQVLWNLLQEVDGLSFKHLSDDEDEDWWRDDDEDKHCIEYSEEKQIVFNDDDKTPTEIKFIIDEYFSNILSAKTKVLPYYLYNQSSVINQVGNLCSVCLSVEMVDDSILNFCRECYLKICSLCERYLFIKSKQMCVGCCSNAIKLLCTLCLKYKSESKCINIGRDVICQDCNDGLLWNIHNNKLDICRNLLVHVSLKLNKNNNNIKINANFIFKSTANLCVWNWHLSTTLNKLLENELLRRAIKYYNHGNLIIE